MHRMKTTNLNGVNRMKTYLFEIFDKDIEKSVYQEATADTYEDAKVKILAEWPDAYILNAFIQYYGEI